MLTIEKVYQENKKSVDAWKKASRTAGGRLKRNIYFGTQCKEPVKRGQTLVWIGSTFASTNEVEQKRVTALVKLLVERSSVKVFCENEQAKNELSEHYSKVIVGNEREALNLLATSENVVSVAMLPILYRKRSGQRHVHLITESDFVSSRYERANNGLACIFSTDQIVARSIEEMNRFAAIYQLNGAYKGSLICIDQDHLVDVVLDDAGDAVGVTTCNIDCQAKKKILLFCDCCPNNISSEYCQHLIKSIDLDVFDVTVVLQCYNEPVLAYQFIDDLDERVRIFSRIGSFSCDADDYVNVQVINEIVLDSNDPVGLLKLVPPSILEDEIDRILPGMEFDAFVYCARDRKMWTLLSSAIRASHKTMLQLEYRSSVLINTDDEEKLLRFVNKAKLISYIFHSVGFANSEMMKGLVPHLNNTDVWTWNSVVPILKTSHNDNIRSIQTEVEGRQLQLVVQENKKQNGPIKAYIYSPFIAQKPHYMTFINIDEANGFFKSLKWNDNNYTLSIFVENSSSLSPFVQLPESTEDIRINDLSSFVNSPLSSYYVSTFDGYLNVTDSEDNSLKALVLEMGLPLYREVSGELVPEQIDTNKAEEIDRLHSVNRIFGV